MEKLDLCLDTDFAIDFIKGDKRIIPFLDKIHNSKINISSITAFELNLRETKLDIIKDFIDEINVFPFNLETAKIASTIYKDLKKKGRQIEIRDLFIAATCLTNNCILLTFNKKHFDNVKNIKLL